MLRPSWSCDPISGNGAKRNGGRFNQIGTQALYLSEQFETAVTEYLQESDRPGTLCPYHLEIKKVVDLTSKEVLLSLGINEELLYSDWRESKTHETWNLSTRLILLGVKGAIFSSVQRKGGKNLVLWNWNDLDVKVFDPRSDLPKDDLSWRKS